MPRTASSQTGAPVAKKTKGLGAAKAKRHIKHESARAARIRAEPVRGISSRRIKVYGRQHMIFSMDTSGVEAVRTILAAMAGTVLERAITLAAGNRRRTLRRSDIIDAYERATTRSRQLLHAPYDRDETPEARSRAKDARRRLMQRALADGTATLDSRRSAAAAEEAEEEEEEEEEDAYDAAEEQASDSDAESEDAASSDGDDDDDEADGEAF